MKKGIVTSAIPFFINDSFCLVVIKRLIYTLIIIFSTVGTASHAQVLKSYTIEGLTDTIDQHTHTSPEDAHQHISQLIRAWHKAGHLLAAADSIHSTDSAVLAFVYRGPKYHWNEIRISHLPDDLQKHISRKWGQPVSRVLSTEELGSLYDMIYNYAEEHQYPFAEVYFDSLEISDDQMISARLMYDPGTPARIDSVHVHYDGFLSRSFLRNYFGLYDGMPYDIAAFRAINAKVAALPFVRLARPWEISFGYEKNELNLYLQDRKANQANAIAGLQPSGQEDSRYIITADILFKIHNTFGYGEMFHLTYQQIRNNSPKFFTAIQWPYLFNTKWGTDAAFEFMKYDTMFRKTNAHIGAKYQIDEQNYFSVFYENESNRTIHFDTNYIRIHKKLPANIDVRKQGLGLSYQYGRLDDPLMPSRGLMARLTGVSYTKSILKNNAIENISDRHLFDYDQLFDSIRSPIFQFRLQSDLEYYFTAGRLVTFKISNHNGWIGGNEFIYYNELFTLGGHKMLRGFNELSVFASQYVLGILEPRIFIGDNSYVFAFADLAWVKAHYQDNQREGKSMLSAGLGAQLNTSSGLFNIAFALGKDGRAPLPGLRDTRVHIGYSIYF